MYVGRITVSYKFDRMGRYVLLATLLRSDRLRPPICSTRFSVIEDLLAFKNQQFEYTKCMKKYAVFTATCFGDPLPSSDSNT
jgi:hypothetical protein